MYEYENGIKKKNIGFARVEIRNGECRFTIHMQLDGLAEGIFPTYLIHRPNDEMDLVYLGDCSVKKQVMDSRLSAKEFNVMDSGYRFSDMGGILLFLNSGVFYATQWDDKPVVLKEVLDALKPKTKPEIFIEKEAEIRENHQTVKNTEAEPVKMEIKMPGEKPADSIPVFVQKPVDTDQVPLKKPIADTPISDNKSSELKEDTAKSKEDTEASRPKYMLPGGGMMNNLIFPSRPKTPTNPWELVERYKKAEGKKVSEAEKKVSDTPIEKSMANNWQRENPLAARIFANYPRIYPFEDSEIRRCVKIEPKDIGALPSDTWILSNNSFLLHGYYCYHHLIFAEIIDRYGCRYILGVPGIYHNRERFMARMFGFECFKSIRKRELKQGDFGYWYLEVNF